LLIVGSFSDAGGAVGEPEQPASTNRARVSVERIRLE
jgi:hypothetical protein